MSDWNDMLVGGGMLVVTRKGAFPGLAGTDLPDILVKSVVQFDGDVVSKVEKRLVEGDAYLDFLPEVWEVHFTNVRKRVPKFGLLDQFLRVWSWVGGAMGLGWGGLQQFYADFPDWAALWPAFAGLGLIVARFLIKWGLRRMVGKGLRALQLPQTGGPAVPE
ncbi:MAG TPA: hypothetical protein ENJ82_12695 [Bacteroidetes bacterium]|nr:hypothetical protein [Bacteroidota bacterium]